MKKLSILYILSTLILFSSCNFGNFDIYNRSVIHSSAPQLTYNAEITHSSDDKGIHISVPIDKEKTYTTLSVYELRNENDILLAKVTPAEKWYRYLINDTPCGYVGYEKTGNVDSDDKTKITTSYRTNFLSGQVDVHLYFLEPGRKYNLLVRLDEEDGEFNDVVTKETGHVNNVSEKYNVFMRTMHHFSSPFTETASSNISYTDMVKATYDGTNDKYTYETIDFKDAKYPFGIVDDKDYLFNAEIKYESSKNKMDNFTVPYIAPPEYVPISSLIEKTQSLDYTAEYKLKETAFSLVYKDHRTLEIDESNIDAIDNATKLKYYTEMYQLKEYEYSINGISTGNIPASIIVPDKSVKLKITPVEEGNLIEFELKDAVSGVSIYREEDNFQVGSINAFSKPKSSFSFTDHYPREGKNTYYVKWNGSSRSASCSVNYSLTRKYIPVNAAATYDAEKGILTFTTNPIAHSIPEKYIEQLAIEYKTTVENYDSSSISVQNTTDTYFEYIYNLENDAVITLNIKKDTSTVNLSGIVKPLGLSENFIDKVFNCSNYSHELSIETTNDDVRYTNYYKVTETKDMPEIKILDTRNTYKPGDTDDTNDTETEIPDEIKKISAGFKKTTDYIKIISIEETDNGVALNLYVPECTNKIQILREKAKFDSNGYIQTNSLTLSSTYRFDMKKIKYGNITLNDYLTEKDTPYIYYVDSDAVNPNKEMVYDKKLNYNKNYQAYIITTKASPYEVSSIPDIQAKVNEKDFNWKSSFTVAGTLQFNKSLPENYKTIESYNSENSIYTTALYGNKLYYYDKVSTYNNLLFKCTEVKSEDKIAIDIYGQTSPIIFNDNDPRLEREFTYYDTTKDWNSSYFNSPVRGTYELKKISANIFNENGIWQYREVPFAAQKFTVN